MALADTRHGPRRPLRQGVKAAFRLIHHRLGVPALGRLRLFGPDGGRDVRVDMSNTAYMQFVLAERRGGFEPELTALLARLGPHLGTVFDVGANCGFFSARVVLTPGFAGRVHAFELMPATHKALARMVYEAELDDRVTCHAFGLSDGDGEVPVQVGMHSTLARVAEDGTARATVRALDGLDLPAPDLIKIDVEGHESRVIAGARSTLETARPHVVFESWPRPQDPTAARAPFDALAELGYQIFVLRPEADANDRIRLSLIPVDADTRQGIDDQVNVLAVHRDRLDAFAAAFQGR